MALLSKQNREVLGNPLNLDNPIMVQVLGICSALPSPRSSSPQL
jgi:Na+-transporting NADH:ubiquinone oxidoreductase subunit D